MFGLQNFSESQVFTCQVASLSMASMTKQQWSSAQDKESRKAKSFKNFVEYMVEHLQQEYHKFRRPKVAAKLEQADAYVISSKFFVLKGCFGKKPLLYFVLLRFYATGDCRVVIC